MNGIDWVIEKLEEHPELYVNDKDQDVLRCQILYYLKLYKNRLEQDEYNHMKDAFDYAVHMHDWAKKQPEYLTWSNLEDMFGKPVYYVQKETQRNCHAKGWIILHELHITEYGSFVIGTDDTQYKYEDCKFYKEEI